MKKLMYCNNSQEITIVYIATREEKSAREVYFFSVSNFKGVDSDYNPLSSDDRRKYNLLVEIFLKIEKIRSLCSKTSIPYHFLRVKNINPPP